MKSAAVYPNPCDVITQLEDRKQQVINLNIPPICATFLKLFNFFFAFDFSILANTNATTASVTTQENNSFMSNVMLLSPLNDDGSNSLTSSTSVAMETDQSVYDLQKDMQQRPAGELLIHILYTFSSFFFSLNKITTTTTRF